MLVTIKIIGKLLDCCKNPSGSLMSFRKGYLPPLSHLTTPTSCGQIVRSTAVLKVDIFNLIHGNIFQLSTLEVT